jgi:hypothetical protein
MMHASLPAEQGLAAELHLDTGAACIRHQQRRSSLPRSAFQHIIVSTS